MADGSAAGIIGAVEAAARVRMDLEVGIREARSGLRLAEFTTGDVMLREGDAPDAALFLLTGSVRVFRISPGGDLIVLAHRRANDLLGELGVLDGDQRSGWALALEPTTAIAIVRAEFLRRMQSDAAFANAVALQLCLRVREASERAFALAAMPVAARLAAELLRTALNGPRGEPSRIPLLPAVTDLAARINTTRESASKTLNRWLAAGVLERRGGGLVIRRPDQLSAALES